MGPVNSNHFAPQTQQFYARYHQRALDRAAECKAMSIALAGSGGRFDAYLKAFEIMRSGQSGKVVLDWS